MDLMRISESSVYCSPNHLTGIPFVLGILVNGLVIWVAGLQMAHTITTLCYLNLALANFSFIATLPFHMISMAMKEQWASGWFLCKLINIIVDINLLGSVFLIAFIALDRCICVQNHHTVSLATKVITGPWILAVVLSSQIFLFMTIIRNRRGNTYYTFNFASWANTTEERMKVTITVLTARGIIRFTVGFTMLMSIIAICYGLIAVKIRKKDMTNSSCPLWVLTAVMASSFICWLPFQLNALLKTVWLRKVAFEGKYKVTNILLYLTRSLAFFNICFNPMLYVFVGQDFQERLIHSLPASLERALTEDSAAIEDSAPTSDNNNQICFPFYRS